MYLLFVSNNISHIIFNQYITLQYSSTISSPFKSARSSWTFFVKWGNMSSGRISTSGWSKATSRDLRVGDGEVGFRKGQCCRSRGIDVDCAGAVSLLSGRPAKGPFDAFELIEEFLRLHFGGKFERSVEERRRLSWTVHGRSFVDLEQRTGRVPEWKPKRRRRAARR